jgi:hypothetical protein
MKVVLTELFRKFRFEVVSPVEAELILSLRPKQVRLKVFMA